MFSISFTMASNPSGSALAAQKKLTKQIENHVDYPEFAKSLSIEGEVNVKFKVGEDGRLEITNVAGADEALVREVEKNLEGATIVTDPNLSGQHFSINIEFRLV